MGQEVPSVSITRLRTTWDAEVRPSSRRALWALVFAALFGAAHLGRLGTPLGRGLAGGALLLVLLGLAARAIVLRRRRADLRRTVRDTVGRLDPELGSATLRALSLVERTSADPHAGSPSLAGLHLARLLGKAPVAEVAARAARAGKTWSAVGLALGALSAAIVLAEPFRIVEGLDTLAAREGEAPLSLDWLGDVEMAAVPPEYLHQPPIGLSPFAHGAAPRGSVITVRGRPIHAGRELVLTDGHDEEPFVEDGSGSAVARFTLGDTTTLFIAARFGDVRIRQSDEQPMASIPDALPEVKVEGAPRTVRLLDEPSVPVHYEAYDDHGLREVHLVLRAGTREERRVLSHPTADAKVDRGGYEIKASDPFFKRTYIPVEVRVEARDNDVVAGPKWGKSAPILLVLPQVGEAEAMRYAAMIKARDAVTDLLAFRLGEPMPAKAKAPPAKGAPATPATPTPKEHTTREAEAQKKALDTIEDALGGSYGGLSVRGRMATLARGQLRRIEEALKAEAKSPAEATHQKLLDETEDALLALDVGVRSMGVRDTRAVAKRLADVADEAAAAASGESGTEPAASKARLDAAVEVLAGGGAQLLRLGDLGLDLGEIVQNDLRRIARARAASDLRHAELAARDLAARLRRPEPSFAGGGGHGGVESGSSSGSSAGDKGEASQADEEARAAAQELEDLTRDHGSQTDEVEETLDKAASPEEIAALKQEAKQHADAIREAVKQLPRQGGDPGSAEGAAAAGREQAESMAAALEAAELKDAVENGQKASQSLGEAKRAGEQNKGFFPEERAGRDAGRAKEALERELAWAEDALEKLRKLSQQRAKNDLDKAGKGEKRLAERARELGKTGEKGDRSLPQELLDRLGEAEQAMRDAEKALGEGDGERGLRHQKDAQRLLEMAKEQQSEDAQEGERGARESAQEDSEGKQLAKKTEIPGKDKHKGPQEFRRRVMEGLGGSSDPVLREAVKRYAEGLLR
ncbi:MAG: DUF4175 family protein [Byssovorax sp.]